MTTFDILPFSNFVAVAEGVPEAQLKEIMANAVSDVENAGGRFAQIAGFTGWAAPWIWSGAKRVIVAMNHTAKGRPKIVRECSLPLTSVRPVSLVVTDLAVIEPTADGLMLKERAPGVAVEDIQEATEAALIVPLEVPEMVAA